MQQKVIPYRHGNIIYLGFAFSGRRLARPAANVDAPTQPRAEVIALASRRPAFSASAAQATQIG